MKKRILGIIVALLVAGTTGAFASTALGLQGGYNPATTGAGASLTFKLSSFDAVFSADVDIRGGHFNSAGLTADYWLKNPRLFGIVHYYYGPGVAFAFAPASSSFYIAGRVFGGVNVFVIPELELYAQIAWQPGVWINGDGVSDDWWSSCPFNIGFRFWF